jgi:hypothetical protein
VAKVEGVGKLTAQMQALEARGEPGAVVVGFTAAYAIYVHENLQAYHKVGQAKFLEQPARTMARDLGRIIAVSLKAGRTLAEALLLAGLQLQRAAQLLCPVDTGALRASAFTRVETPHAGAGAVRRGP